MIEKLSEFNEDFLTVGISSEAFEPFPSFRVECIILRFHQGNLT